MSDDNDGDFRIGTRDEIVRFWDGLVDEVAIFSDVLTSAERTWLYNGGNGRAYNEINITNPWTNDLEAWWALNEAAGIRYDSHINNNDLVFDAGDTLAYLLALHVQHVTQHAKLTEVLFG